MATQALNSTRIGVFAASWRSAPPPRLASPERIFIPVCGSIFAVRGCEMRGAVGLPGAAVPRTGPFPPRLSRSRRHPAPPGAAFLATCHLPRLSGRRFQEASATFCMSSSIMVAALRYSCMRRGRMLMRCCMCAMSSWLMVLKLVPLG